MSTAASEETPKVAEGLNSGLLRELNSIPLVETATTFVCTAQKDSRVVRTGMAILEYSFTSVAGMFGGGHPMLASIDSAAEKKLITLKKSYPTMTQSPKELQNTAYSTVRKTVRVAMKTPPGKVVLSGLDWAVKKSTSTLKRLGTNQQPPDQIPAKVAAEHAYASEDSGAFEPEMRSTSKEPLAALSALTEKDSLLTKAYKLGILYPIERLVALLRYVRRYIGGSRKVEKKSSASASLAARRTIKSPRKRVQTSLWTSMKNAAFKLMGATAEGRLLGISFRTASKTPVSPGNADRKRPHDEILTDEGSESDDSLANFDIDNYDSDEDPDYEPAEDSGEETDDESYSEGEMESDLDKVVLEGQQLIEGTRREGKTQKAGMEQKDKTTPQEKTVAPDGKTSVKAELKDKDASNVIKITSQDMKNTSRDKHMDKPAADKPQIAKHDPQGSKSAPKGDQLAKTTKDEPKPSEVGTHETKKSSPEPKKENKNRKGRKSHSPDTKTNKGEVKGKESNSKSEGMNPTVLLEDIVGSATSTDSKTQNGTSV